MVFLRKNDTLVIILVYNEAENIVVVIDDLQKNTANVDILVVNDGSIDKTLKAIVGKNVFIISHPFNLGIGASFQTGCRFALLLGYKFVVRLDGDGQHSVSSIKDILTPVKADGFDIVIGSRFLGDSEFKSSFLRRLGIVIISWVLRVITHKEFTDPTSGFCAMNKKAYMFFAEFCVEDYPEPEIILHHSNFRIKETPVLMKKRQSGLSSITPIKSLYYMFKVLLSLCISIFRKE